MESIGAYEAKTHLPRLLARVAKGERIVITKHGVPIAVLQPLDREHRTDLAEIIAELKTLRHKHRLIDLSVKELIDEGRR
ncbi:MAG: type II toxin-antitoxin system prevent-host-death family antitoxin [Deltaproteobacteria bacterium]|nr:type II toxin-antitoxin system prevent-host-death family antitoxin [Deltaproteobacteria bacterium]